MSSNKVFNLKFQRALYITKTWKKKWENFKNLKKISKELIKLKKVFVNISKKVDKGETELFWIIIYEFFWAKLLMNKELPVKEWLKYVFGNFPIPISCNRVIIQVLDIMFSEISTSNTFQRKALIKLTKEISDPKLCGKRFLWKHISNYELISNSTIWKGIKGERTKIFYKQETYNLFHETSEGFSKLATFLGEIAIQNLNLNYNYFKNNLEHIVGTFNLNVNRVTDCILQFLEVNPENKILFKYVSKENKITLTHLLGFKFEGFKCFQTKKTPESLYHLTIKLLSNDIIDLDLLLSHLSPTIKETINSRYKIEREERNAAIFLIKHNLNERDDEKLKRLKKNEEDTKKRKKARSEKKKNNQILELLNRTLDPKSLNFYIARRLFIMLESAVPTSFSLIRRNIFRIIRYLIYNLYQETCQHHFCLITESKKIGLKIQDRIFSMGYFNFEHIWSLFPESKSALNTFPAKILPWMYWLSIYASEDIELCSILLRLASVCMQNKPNVQKKKMVTNLICIICGAFSSMKFNRGIANDIWSVLQHFTYEIRYSIYGYWTDTIYNKYSELFYVSKDELKNTKYFLKRYKVELDQKKIGREISKISNNNPIIVFSEIIFQLQCYNRNIKMIADAMRYLNYVTEDIFIWLILKQLEKIASIGVTRIMTTNNGFPRKWFKALSLLIGNFSKRSASGKIDLTSLFEYFVNKLKCDHNSHVFFFSKIISKISGIESFGDLITNKQLEALSGSKNLRFLAIYDNIRGNSRKTMIRSCIQQMYARKLIFPMFILLSHMKDKLSSGNYDEYYNSKYSLIYNFIDQVNDCFVQLYEFLETYQSLTTEDLSNIFPSLYNLIINYNMPHELAFHICRSCLGKIKISSPNMYHQFSDPFKAFEETCKLLLDNETLKTITSPFYASFWAYKPKEITNPLLQYKKYIKKLQNDLNILEKRSSDHKEIKRLKIDILKLNEDCIIQEKTNKMIFNFCRKHHKTWFKNITNPELTARTILFKCIIPRCCLSDLDAKYCFHFLLFLINENIENFNLLNFVWEIIQSIYQILCSFTTAETRRFGKFFLEILTFLESWRKSQQTFDFFYPNLSLDVLTIFNILKIKNNNFTSILRIFRQLITYHLVSNIISNDPHRQKNSIIFLYQLINQYPRLKTNHNRLTKAIRNLSIIPKSSIEILCKHVLVILNKRLTKYTLKKKCTDHLKLILEKKKKLSIKPQVRKKRIK